MQKQLTRFFFPAENTTYNLLFWLIMFFAILVRTVLLGDIPGGLNQDEASIGYDAFAVLNYGIDRHGFNYPVHFISWGSGQNALYAYFSMPFIKLLGLNVVSIRLANVVLGIISLFVIFQLGKLIKDEKLGLIALFVLAISPWHIMMNRWALESNLLPPLILFAIYFFCLARIKPNALIASFAFLALSVYAYGTAYVFAPLLFLFLVFNNQRLNYTSWKIWPKSIVIAAVIATPLITFLMVNLFKLDAIDLSFISMPKYTGVARYSTQSNFFSSDFFFGLLNNAMALWQIIKTGSGHIHNTIPGYGYLFTYGILLAFLGLGFALFELIKTKAKHNITVILSWLLAAIIVSLFVQPNINRVNVIFIPIIFLAAYGIYRVSHFSKIAALVPIVYLTFSFNSFSKYYFNEYPEQIGPPFFQSYQQAFTLADSYIEQGDTLYLTHKVHYTLPLFFSQIDPNIYVDTVNIPDLNREFQHVASFGHYVFGINNHSKNQGKVFVIHNDELAAYPENNYIIKRFKNYSVAFNKKYYGQKDNDTIEKLNYQLWMKKISSNRRNAPFKVRVTSSEPSSTLIELTSEFSAEKKRFKFSSNQTATHSIAYDELFPSINKIKVTVTIPSLNAQITENYTRFKSDSSIIKLTQLPITGQQDWGKLAINQTAGKTALVSAGKTYPWGLGTHGTSRYEIELNGDYNQLTTFIGLSDFETCGDGATFSVFADNKLLYSKHIINAQVEKLSLDVTKTNTLTLTTERGQHNHCDHTNWLMPLLHR